MPSRRQLAVEALHFGYNATEHIVQPDATRMGFVQRDEVALHLLVAGGVRVHFATGDVHDLRPQALMVSWGGPPHRAEWRERDTHLFGVTVPLPWVLGWPLPESFRRLLLDGKPLSIPAPGEAEVATFRRWVRDLQAGDAEAGEIALLEIQARLRRFARDWQGQAGAAQAPVGGRRRGYRRIRQHPAEPAGAHRGERGGHRVALLLHHGPHCRARGDLGTHQALSLRGKALGGSDGGRR
jgi:hypothetical protein